MKLTLNSLSIYLLTVRLYLWNKNNLLDIVSLLQMASSALAIDNFNI